MSLTSILFTFCSTFSRTYYGSRLGGCFTGDRFLSLCSFNWKSFRFTALSKICCFSCISSWWLLICLKMLTFSSLKDINFNCSVMFLLRRQPQSFTFVTWKYTFTLFVPCILFSLNFPRNSIGCSQNSLFIWCYQIWLKRHCFAKYWT